MAQQLEVREGQRYAQRYGVRYRPSVWQVGAIKAGTVPIPHARLVNVEDPLHTKTISCATLTNGTYYALVADPGTTI